jgi:uncharacterized protein (DUF58 family)
MLPHTREPTTRGLRWGAIGIGLLAVLWGASLGVRPVLAYGLAQLAVLALLWYYPRRARADVSLERTMTRGACEEDEVPVRFALVNRGRLPLFVPEVADDFSPDKVPRRVAHVFPLLLGESAAVATYRGNCYAKRGNYLVGPAVLHVSCPLGLFGATVSERRPARLTVYPALERISEQVVGVGLVSGFGGRARLDVGDGDLTLAVREYRPGDSLRRVHWPSCARRGRLTILEYERQLSRRLEIFVDQARGALRGLGRQSTLEVSVRIAAALAGRALSQGDRVSLHARGADVLHVPPGRGDAQLCRILAELAPLKPDGTLPLSEVLRVRATSLSRGQSVALIVADVEQDGLAVLELSGELAARGCHVIAILLDPASFPLLVEAPQAEGSPPTVHDLAEGFLAQGASVYPIRSGQALAEAFLHPYAGRARLRITQEMLA